MKAIRVLVGKLGFTAVGVGVGLILAAGSGAAAIHFTQSVASEHAIKVVQAGSSHDGSTTREDSNVSGADDRVPEAAEPEAGDDSSSRTASTDDSAQGSSRGTAPARTPEPGDDRGRGASAQPGDDKGRGGNH